MMIVLVLETKRLLLRRAQQTDTDDLVEVWSDPQVTRFMGVPRDREKVRQYIEEEVRGGTTSCGTGWWSVIERTSGHVVGECGLLEKNVDGRNEIELVYVFAADAWGKGYATEAASSLRDYAMVRLGLPRIIALIEPENRGSIHVAEKLGMAFERDTCRPNGRTMRVYSLHAV
jgi:RimJ/RimL family protein N-acetyltransferase